MKLLTCKSTSTLMLYLAAASPTFAQSPTPTPVEVKVETCNDESHLDFINGFDPSGKPTGATLDTQFQTFRDKSTSKQVVVIVKSYLSDINVSGFSANFIALEVPAARFQPLTTFAWTHKCVTVDAIVRPKVGDPAQADLALLTITNN